MLLVLSSMGSSDWLTHRGNPGHTGNLDDQPGPKTPAVLWAYKSREHFVASPVPGVKAVYVSGLGAFNTGVFHCIAPEPDAPRRLLWSKAAPYLKRPSVCAPALADGLVVFGDGMHQTDGAVLYCLQADGGRGAWQLPLPGKDIRLECSPTIERGRVYIGGGGAGVLCVNLKRVSLEGKELDLAAAAAMVEQRWTELLARYEQEKKKDPQFAIPPSEESLPKPAPRLLWQKGQDNWYVGSPVAVSGDRLLVASEYLDDEKIGRRCILCLQAGDGSLLWETPLQMDPWAGATVAGDLVLVGCSSIRFDATKISQARGEVVAMDLASGQVKWRKPVPGGVLSSIAVKNDLALFTATDGKVRAWDPVTGEQKWIYDGANPFFAGPAVAGGVVYAADLKAVLHAVSLADGKKQWTFDTTTDAATGSPGMVFGSPIVDGGRIYLATCNLEGQAAGQPSVVLCISDKSAAGGVEPAPAVAVDRAGRTITLPCRIAPRKLPTLKEVYPIEVIASYPHPRGQKAHETVVTFEARPSDVHKALEELGLKPGKPAKGLEGAASGPEVRILLQLPGVHRPRVVSVESCLVDSGTGKPMPPLKWFFTGSAWKQPDPDKPNKVYAADLSGTLIAVFPVTDETVLQSNLTMAEEVLLKLATNKNLLPEEGTAAELIIEVKPSPAPVDEAARPAFTFTPLDPFADAPQPWRSSTLVPVPGGWWLPPADVFDKPRLLSSDRQPPAGERSTVDFPALWPGSNP
ncbi:MAG: hypothetical protein AMJ81_05230, partial [Phycisphaerae bacterium SM23_33]